MPLDATGAVGEAMRLGDVVVVAGYGHASPAIRDLTGGRLCASMAAPVHENGAVVGGLLVASYEPERCYTPNDKQKLGAFAQNVSLALTDAHTLDKVNRAVHDTLTGLASRGLFLEQLTGHLAEGGPAALLFIDLDRFKPVNDTFGHAAGDQLLVATAERIRAELRDADLAGRLGGDEFAVMLRGVTTLDEAIGVARRLVRRIGRPVDLDGHTVSVDASIGIAMSADAGNAAELMHHADVTMYDAKRSGRGRYRVFSRDLLEAA
jgi:diguanylate cyclase (GGDEF)-like protein